MGTTENESAWSTTAATNSTADAGINWAEGQDSATVNNSARGMMAGRAKARLDQGGGLSAGGTANALTSGTNQILSSGHLAGGLRLLVKATADNTSTTVTFAPDGLTAGNIKRADGSALAIGSIKSGMYLDLVYNSGSSEWRCANIGPVTAGVLASNLAVFSARPSGDQAIATGSYTKISFQTEDFDVGSYFDAATNYRWTPPAGYIRLAAYVSVKNVTAGSIVGLKIFKNGTTIVKEVTFAMALAATSSAIYAGSIEAFDTPNGTDYYEIFIANSDTSYSVGQVAASFGSGNATWFMGHMI